MKNQMLHLGAVLVRVGSARVDMQKRNNRRTRKRKKPPGRRLLDEKSARRAPLGALAFDLRMRGKPVHRREEQYRGLARSRKINFASHSQLLAIAGPRPSRMPCPHCSLARDPLHRMEARAAERRRIRRIRRMW